MLAHRADKHRDEKNPRGHNLTGGIYMKVYAPSHRRTLHIAHEEGRSELENELNNNLREWETF